MADRAKLLEALRSASADLPDVVEKKMFGCESLFTGGRIFALVWKAGRIALKLPVPERYAALASQRGAAPWSPNDRAMGAWLLVPPKLEEPKALSPWLREAHAMAGAAPEKKAVSIKTATKKAAPKKKAAARAKKSASAKKPKRKTMGPAARRRA